MFLTRLHTVDVPPDRFMLTAPLIWDDARERVEVPTGFTTDFATIPPPFKPFLNPTGPSRRPAGLHDFLYYTGQKTRREADDLFVAALKAEGVGPIGRAAYYSGVRSWGWWPWRNHRKRDAARQASATA